MTESTRSKDERIVWKTHQPKIFAQSVRIANSLHRLDLLTPPLENIPAKISVQMGSDANLDFIYVTR